MKSKDPKAMYKWILKKKISIYSNPSFYSLHQKNTSDNEPNNLKSMNAWS